MPHARYQTVRELADRLEVAEATVRRWIKTGELRAIDKRSKITRPHRLQVSLSI